MDYDKFLSITGRTLQESAIRRMGTVIAEAANMISFAAGYPDPNAFPWNEFRTIANGVLAGSDVSALQYGPTRGYKPLLETIREVLRQRDIHASIEHLIITTGSQQGLDLVGRVLVSPGEVVLVELPAYTGAIAALKNAGAQLCGVRQDHDGINLDDLDSVCKAQRRAGRSVKLLYVVPNFQNPSGVLLSLTKRTQLLEWAERNDILIVEDDPYGSLYFEDVATVAETRPLRADDQCGRVLYLSSFSKTLAPGFRVGWITAPEALADRFETAKQSVDLASGTLDQRIVHKAVVDGVVDRIAPGLRALYRQKRDVMEHALRETIGPGLSWHSPKGGFFLWAELPVHQRDNDLLERAMAHGLVFVVGSAFHVDGTGHNLVRLSFSAPSIDSIREGVNRLAAALLQVPSAVPGVAPR